MTIEPKGSLEVIPKVGTYPIMLIAHQNLNSIFGEKVVVILTSTICEEFFQPHPHSKNSKPSTLLLIIIHWKRAPGGAAQLASAMKMKFHEVSSSIPPDLPCVSRKGHRGHTWRL